MCRSCCCCYCHLFSKYKVRIVLAMIMTSFGRGAQRVGRRLTKCVRQTFSLCENRRCPGQRKVSLFMLCYVILFYFAFYFSLLQRKKIDSPLLQQCLYIFSSFYYVDLCHVSCDFNLHHNFVVTGLQLDDVIVVDLVSDPIPGWLANLDDWAITTCVHDLKADWFG